MAEARETDGQLPAKCGIFGPTSQVSCGLSLDELMRSDENGTVLEFCTEDANQNFDNTMLLEDKYFGSPDMMKCSYILEELTAPSDDDDSIPAFERLAMKMKNVIENGGVKKSVLSEGVGVVVPSHARVRAHYHAFLEDMVEPYDSSYLQGKELKITLGKGHVIPGLDLAIASMRKAEKSRFLVQPEYAYGATGCAPRIPKNAVLLFEVELLSYTESSILDECVEDEDERGKFSFERVLDVAKAEKTEGNDLFRQCQYSKAQRKFMRCIIAMESVRLKDQAEEDEMIKITSKAYQNMALCALKLGNFGKALAAGRRVLEYDPNHPKALYIAGKALRHIGDFSAARKYMLRARAVAPCSGDVTKELKLIDKEEEKCRRAAIDMCKKMFNKTHINDRKESTLAEDGRAPQATEGFQNIIEGRLKKFTDDQSTHEIFIPVASFTRREISCARETAGNMGLGVEVIDKPGKTKQLKITKKEK